MTIMVIGDGVLLSLIAVAIWEQDFQREEGCSSFSLSLFYRVSMIDCFNYLSWQYQWAVCFLDYPSVSLFDFAMHVKPVHG